ncbi:MAG TPA: hypothetical protein VJN18_22705 [Polyangiaceae bacterium]|nr:hypothetical protein [Polyangiaceae bacterium]
MQGLGPGKEDAGEGGTGPELPLGPPYGTSTACGDAIVGLDALGNPEECDDGGDDAPDACTDACQTRDQPIVSAPANAWTSRVLGAGRHPVAGLSEGFITTFVDTTEEDPRVGARLFNIWGQPAQEIVVSEGARPIFEANPVAAALPNGGYAVAWSSFDEDGEDLGVAVRRVAEDGTLGPLRIANQVTQFSQLDPDMIWTGSELVVAWVDFADAVSGPNLRYRRFDENLIALGDEAVLAASSGPESAIALAPFNGGWAAAYREGLAGGTENVVVKVGEQTFRVGPVLGGPIEDRPALVELDETHLLLLFSAGTDPALTGTHSTPRIRHAVVDTQSTSSPPVVSLDPLDDVFMKDVQVSHVSPSVVKGPDGIYLSWRSEARPGDAGGDQIWLKHLSWDSALETELNVSEPEVLIPRVCEGSVGNQRTPQLAHVGLPPHGALAVAWDDYSQSQGVGEPDVTVHYAPLHPRPAEGPSLVTEEWRGSNNDPWPSPWTHLITTTGNLPVNIQNNEARIWSNGGSGTAISYINDHKALDVEMFTKVRWALNSSRAGFVARLTDTAPPSYIAGRVGTLINDTWKIYAVIADTTVNPPTTSQIDIVLGPSTSLGSPFAIFSNWAQELEFFMRFRITSSGGSINVAMKLWLSDLPEPTAWTMQGSTSNATIMSTLGNTPGRFGLYANNQQANRMTYFDDFRATFYEGSTLGDPTTVPRSAPLWRQPATYRNCTPGSPCELGEGCCFDDLECGSGLTCQSAQNEIFGVGSHAQVCSVAHCGDQVRQPEETRVDCGGDDCAPCQCTSTAAPGSATYCNSTPGCACGLGDGSCSSNAECLPGLACKSGGNKYGWGAISVCQPFHCFNRIQDSTLASPETNIDCGGECGECYWDPTNGTSAHCRVYHQCESGHGRCSWNDECSSGLVCGATSQGVKWGLPSGTSVCVIPHCDNNIFEPALGETSKDCGGPDCGPICP